MNESENKSADKIKENTGDDKGKRKSPRGFGKGFLAGVLVCALLFSLIGCSLADGLFEKITGKSASGEDSDTETSTDELINEEVEDKLDEIQEILDKYYMYDTDEDAMREGVYAGVIAALQDPYTVYYTAEEAEEQFDSLEGIYYGIGVVITEDTEGAGSIFINQVYEDSPAEEAGVRAGDVFVRVDGESCEDMTTDDIANAVRGEEGSSVTLTLSRDGREMDFTMTRREITAETVSLYMLENNIAYIYISEFAASTADDFQEAYDTVLSENAEGLIIDLRWNTGGDMDACVDMMDTLLADELLVYTVDKNGNKKEYTGSGSEEISLPLAILTNDYTASASEAFTGALQDYDVATVIGTKTYGKGVVQYLMPLSDGSMIRLTSMHYYTPKGRDLSDNGIEPDIEVALSEGAELGYYYGQEPIAENDAQLSKAIETVKAEQEGQ